MMNLIKTRPFLKIGWEPAALQPLSCSGRCSDPGNSSWRHFLVSVASRLGWQAALLCRTHRNMAQAARRGGKGSWLSEFLPVCGIWEARLHGSLLETPWPAQSKGARWKVKGFCLYIRVGASVQRLRWLSFTFTLLLFAIAVLKIHLSLISKYFLHVCKCHVSYTNTFPLSTLEFEWFKLGTFFFCSLHFEHWGLCVPWVS